MVDKLYDEAEIILTRIKQESPNDKTLIIQKCSKHLTINILEKIIENDCNEEILRVGYILTMKCYFISEVLCEDIYEFFEICKSVGEKYKIVDEVKTKFFNYLISRLNFQRLTPDKLIIIKFIHEKAIEIKDSVFDVCKMWLNLFYEKYLNIPNFLDVNEYYNGVLLGELIIETYFTPGFLDIDKLLEFFIKLINQISQNPMKNLSYYNRAMLFLRKIHQFLYLPVLNTPEYDKYKLNYSEILTLTYNNHPRIFDHPIHSIAKSIENIKETAKKAEIDINPYLKINIWRRETDRYEMKIYHYDNQDDSPMILKQYGIKNNSTQIKSILLEIKANEIAESIREILGDETCFLQYFGLYIDEEEKINLVMKNGGNTLAQILLNNQNRKIFEFTETELKVIFKKLIRSFYELQKAGIFHSDIKSQNLLVDDAKNVTIIDYNCCRIIDKKQEEATIKGTLGYASPELAFFLNKDMHIRSLRFDVEKSDVFSLGVVLMEMIYIKALGSENTYERLENLNGYLDKIEYDWAKSLITGMIKKDPWDRPDFKELNEIINLLLRNT